MKADLYKLHKCFWLERFQDVILWNRTYLTEQQTISYRSSTTGLTSNSTYYTKQYLLYGTNQTLLILRHKTCSSTDNQTWHEPDSLFFQKQNSSNRRPNLIRTRLLEKQIKRVQRRPDLSLNTKRRRRQQHSIAQLQVQGAERFVALSSMSMSALASDQMLMSCTISDTASLNLSSAHRFSGKRAEAEAGLACRSIVHDANKKL